MRTSLVAIALAVSLTTAAAQRADISNARLETGNASIAQRRVAASAITETREPDTLATRVLSRASHPTAVAYLVEVLK